jgi:hypothetical protein
MARATPNVRTGRNGDAEARQIARLAATVKEGTAMSPRALLRSLTPRVLVTSIGATAFAFWLVIVAMI